jgi:hypothetical protein
MILIESSRDDPGGAGPADFTLNRPLLSAT